MGKIIVEQRDDWSWVCSHCKKTNKYIYEYEEGCSGQGNLTCQFCNEDTWDPQINMDGKKWD